MDKIRRILFLLTVILQVKADYSSPLVSFYHSEPPVNNNYTVVKIAFEVKDVTEVDDAKQLIGVKMDIRMSWEDPRVQINESYININNNGVTSLNSSLVKLIWFPDISSKNLESFKVLRTTTTLSTLKFDSKNEHFYYSASILVKFTCSMHFDKFPFDSHACNFKMQLSYPRERVRFENQRVDRFNFTSILDFETSKLELDPHETTETFTDLLDMKRKNYSVAGFKLNFRRKSANYIFNYYIPSGLFVLVSWMSFFIPPDISAARIALIITTTLVIINIANSAFSLSPLSNSMNPIQTWILACVVFVLTTMTEYACILSYQRYVIRKTFVTRREIARQGICLRPMKNDMVGITENSMRILLTKIDFSFMGMTAALFVIFNCVYWNIVST